MSCLNSTSSAANSGSPIWSRNGRSAGTTVAPSRVRAAVVSAITWATAGTFSTPVPASQSPIRLPRRASGLNPAR